MSLKIALITLIVNINVKLLNSIYLTADSDFNAFAQIFTF